MLNAITGKKYAQLPSVKVFDDITNILSDLMLKFSIMKKQRTKKKENERDRERNSNILFDSIKNIC